MPDDAAAVPLDYAPPPARQRTRPVVWLAAALVLAALAGSVFPRKCGHELPGARIAAAKLDVAAIETALDAFEADAGRMPTSIEGLNALVRPPEGLDQWRGPYLRRGRVPTDPWGNAYVYDPTLANGGGRVSSPGPDAKPGTADDIPAVQFVPVR
jgi:general secretion pathway protein G